MTVYGPDGRRAPDTPDQARTRHAGAVGAAERALHWFFYQMWHPDFHTTNYRQAWLDFKAGVPVADVYFARGLPIPDKVNGYTEPQFP